MNKARARLLRASRKPQSLGVSLGAHAQHGHIYAVGGGSTHHSGGRSCLSFSCHVMVAGAAHFYVDYFCFDPFPRGLELPGAPARRIPTACAKVFRRWFRGGVRDAQNLRRLLLKVRTRRTDSATCLANFGLLSTVCTSVFVGLSDVIFTVADQNKISTSANVLRRRLRPPELPTALLPFPDHLIRPACGSRYACAGCRDPDF